MNREFGLTPPKPPKLREADVARACCDLLRLRHWLPLRQQSGLFRTRDDRFVRSGELGLPDYVVMHARYPAFFLETKRPSGELSKAQQRKHWEITVAFGLQIVTIYRVEDLGAWLDNYEKGFEVSECAPR